MKQVLKDLRALRRLLTSRNRWMKYDDVHKTKAGYCFCLRGAAMRVANGTVRKNSSGSGYHIFSFDNIRWMGLRDALNKTPGINGIVLYNDAKHRRHSHILSLIDRTIERVSANA